jgi:hypothetical protein
MLVHKLSTPGDNEKPASVTETSERMPDVHPEATAQAAEAAVPSNSGGKASNPSIAPLQGTLAILRSKKQNITLTGEDGLFDRVMIDENEPVLFSVNLRNLKPGEPVFISAPNGGDLSRQGGGLEFLATSTRQPVKLEFKPSIGRGAFTIRIQHGGESQIIDLWAGAPNPLGEPGPPYIPSQVSTEVP